MYAIHTREATDPVVQYVQTEKMPPSIRSMYY